MPWLPPVIATTFPSSRLATIVSSRVARECDAAGWLLFREEEYTISAKIRNQSVVFVSDGVRSGLRRFGSNSATPLAAAPLGAALRLPGGMQTETHATGCGFSVSGKE